MTTKKLDYWLKEGEQTKITKNIREIAAKFKGNDFEKIIRILDWYNENIKPEYNYGSDIKIFATRSVGKIIKDKFGTGCHDDAAVVVTLLRAVGIPAKYLVGIDRVSPRNTGHCVVEAYVNKKWVLIEPRVESTNIEPRKSSFYKYNIIVGEGLDSWDCGIKTFNDWKKTAKKIEDGINKLEKRR